MKKPINKKIIIGICVIIALIAALTITVVNSLSDRQVTNKLSIEQCQQIVDETIYNLPVSTAEGSKFVLNKTKVAVNSVEYGYEKNIVLSCSYTTLDTKGALKNHINQLLCDAYKLYLDRLDKGKKTSGSDISIRAEFTILEHLEAAAPVSGDVTLTIYETSNGMSLYLDNSMIDTCTGGMLSVYNEIKNTTKINYNGEEVDISNRGTLCTGVSTPISLQNYSSDKPFTGGPLVEAWEDLKSDFYRNFIEKARYQQLISGLGVTLLITFLAALFGIVLGFVIAIIRCTNQMTGKLNFLNSICKFYLSIIRGTPVMVQLLILYYVALSPMGVEKYTAAVICFGLNSGAYVAEIVRGGIMSVDKGQIEAGRSLGFNYVQTMIYFVVPQAFKAIVPSLLNEFITLLKESSVAFAIGVKDLTFGGNSIRSTTYSPFLPLLAVALIYWILVLIMTKLVSILERRLAKSDH